jgi:hypothetical protein
MYDIVERDGGWAIIDTRTGKIAEIDGVEQRDLDIQDADDLVDMLNRFERQKPERLS